MSDTSSSAKIQKLFEDAKISRMRETELERYLGFFENSYQDNLDHCEHVIDSYPRWSIISGYYAMHDITKLYIVKDYRIKIEADVHRTTIEVLNEILKDDEIIALFESGYEEYRNMAGELDSAKRERAKAQYYTGTPFSSAEFKRKSRKFHDEKVVPYIEKINVLIGD
jgi:hypothetical protein